MTDASTARPGEEPGSRARSALVGASDALVDDLPPEAVLETLAMHAATLGEAAFVFVDDELTVRWPANAEPTSPGTLRRLATRAMATSSPAADKEVMDAIVAGRAVDRRRHAVICVPLRARTRILGALALTGPEPDGVPMGALVGVVQALANHAGTAFDSARRYAEQAEAARTLRRALRPRPLPTIDGVQIASRYRPAEGPGGVGGDFYDVFHAGERWAFAVGDVLGKGAEAAALTALVRHTLRAGFLRGDAPGEALALANAAMLEAADDARFCTAAYGDGVVTGDGVILRVALAGHPAGLLRRGDGEIEEVDAGGPALGLFDEATFDERACVLAPGETLLLYTDGATELRGPSTRVSDALLREQLAADGDIDEMLDEIERRALEQSGGQLRDDLALLALRAD